MRKIGTAHLNEIMDEYHLLPTNNYKFGQNSAEIAKIHSTEYEKLFSQGMPDGCWYGCSMACAKAVDGFTVKTGVSNGRQTEILGGDLKAGMAVITDYQEAKK